MIIHWFYSQLSFCSFVEMAYKNSCTYYDTFMTRYMTTIFVYTGSVLTIRPCGCNFHWNQTCRAEFHSPFARVTFYWIGEARRSRSP